MIKIAIPNKGRLCEPSVELLNSAGIRVGKSRKLMSRFRDIEVLFVRAQDIPEYVQDGAADLGITGLDLVKERRARVNVLFGLGFGESRLVVAAPRGIKSVKKGMRVATEFPNLTKDYFRKKKKDVKIVEVSGATEITPYLKIADIITDLTSSGSTLRMNNLREIDMIMETEAVLIGNKKFRDDDLLLAIKSVISAGGKRYVMVNVPRKNLEKVKRIIPGMESPTVMDLADRRYVAVHSVINEGEVFDAIGRLKKIGCKDILVLPIERLVV